MILDTEIYMLLIVIYLSTGKKTVLTTACLRKRGNENFKCSNMIAGGSDRSKAFEVIVGGKVKY